jgi:hypothetical protein
LTAVASSASGSVGLGTSPTSKTPSPLLMPSNLSSSLRNQGITERTSRSLLVVAHNNTNQALIATALCLPCTHYRSDGIIQCFDAKN